MSKLNIEVAKAMLVGTNFEVKESFKLESYWTYVKDNGGKLAYRCAECGTVHVGDINDDVNDCCKAIKINHGGSTNITFVSICQKDHLIRLTVYSKFMSKDTRKDGNQYLIERTGRVKFTFNTKTLKMYFNEAVGSGWHVKQYSRIDLGTRMLMLFDYHNGDRIKPYVDEFYSMVRGVLNKKVPYYSKMPSDFQNLLAFSRKPVYQSILLPLMMGETLPSSESAPVEIYKLYRKLLRCDTRDQARMVWSRHYEVSITKKVFKWSVNDDVAFKAYIVLTRLFTSDQSIHIVMENKAVNRDVLNRISSKFYALSRDVGYGTKFIKEFGINKSMTVVGMGDIQAFYDSIRMYDRLSEMFDGYALRSNSFEEVHQDLSDDLGVVTAYGAVKKTKYLPGEVDNVIKCFSCEIDGITVSPLIYGGEFFDTGSLWGNCVGSYDQSVSYHGKTLVASYDANGEAYLVIELDHEWDNSFSVGDVECQGRMRFERQNITIEQRAFVKKYLDFLNDNNRSDILVSVGGDLESIKEQVDVPVPLNDVLDGFAF